ncbi:hypothetical protein J658_2713 [Acinetobacter baumannii 573719]|nr:hypothetical protein J658_2713 [Acinetobacter baumannii 573719]
MLTGRFAFQIFVQQSHFKVEMSGLDCCHSNLSLKKLANLLAF